VDKKRDFWKESVFHRSASLGWCSKKQRNSGNELVQFLLTFTAESLATSALAEALLRQRLLLI
jgi:hypothetical protein